MRLRLNLLIVVACASGPSLFAKEPAKPPAPTALPPTTKLPKLMEVFTVDENPGSGTLTYTMGDKAVPIAFGKEQGHYGVGMVFDGSILPPAMGEAYRKRKIMQIGLGTFRERLDGKISQFGALTLVCGALPKRTTTYKLTVPNGKDNPLSQRAMMMFLSPETPAKQADEEKLKSTYFAEGGTLTLTPLALPHPLEIDTDNKKLSFVVQMMKLEFQSNLVTPFNAQENELSGTVTVPVYWPNGKAARDLMHRLARESLSAGGPVPLSSDYNPPAPAPAKKR